MKDNMKKRKTTLTKTEELEVGTPEESPNVIAYRVGQLEIKQTESFEKFERKLDGIASGFATKGDLDNIKEDVKNLEDWNTWATRIVISLVIIAVVSTVIISK